MGDPRRLADQLSELGGQWSIRQTTISGTGSDMWIPVVLANPLRYGLIFSSPAGSLSPSGTVVSTLDSGSQSNGMLVPSSGPLVLTYRDVGGLVQVPWWIYDGMLGGGMTVIEILMVQ